MKKLSIFVGMMFAAMLCFGVCSCSKAKADSEDDDEPVKLEFEQIKGKGKDIKYDISWPVKGNKKLLTEIRSWIVEQIPEIPSYSEGEDLESLINSFSSDFYDSVDITVKVEEDAPIEGFITISSRCSQLPYAAKRPIISSDFMVIRLSDGETLSSVYMIQNARKMSGLIIKYLEKEYQKRNPNWRWEKYITNYSQYYFELPMPASPLTFSEDGVNVYYKPGEISGYGFGSFSCTIPFDEARYALKDEVIKFLGLSESAAPDTDSKKLTEDIAIYLIKKANSGDKSVISADLQKNWDIMNFEYNAIFAYGGPPDYVPVKNPAIKIMEIKPVDNGNIVRVVFDVLSTDSPYMGWMTQYDYYPSIYAMDCIKEDGKWVVDDVYSEYGEARTPLSSFTLKNAQSLKERLIETKKFQDEWENSPHEEYEYYDEEGDI